MANLVTAEQAAVCTRFNVQALAVKPEQRVGIARNVMGGLVPLNGLRYEPEGNTSGWYIWAGEELSEDPDFFAPLHMEHLAQWCPAVIPYLALPPGWRILVAPSYEDVWYDDSLLPT